MRKSDELEELNQKWIEKCTCKLKGSCTNSVPGEGSADADILFIGEAPGKKEDEQGKPFVGAAGKFLAEMLEKISLTREDVYITNVLKYRPPNNRDPLPDEVEACWPWLQEQIMLIDPKVIVLLGRHAMDRFLPNKKISEVHGTAMRREISGMGPRVFYVLYHPAAALYQGSLREVLIKDFKRIPKVLKAVEKESNIKEVIVPQETIEESFSTDASEDKQEILL